MKTGFFRLRIQHNSALKIHIVHSLCREMRLHRGKRVLSPLSFARLAGLELVIFSAVNSLIVRAKALTAAAAAAAGNDTKEVSGKLRERAMLVVTGVNGCHICRSFHTRKALEEGCSDEEIARALSFDSAEGITEELLLQAAADERVDKRRASPGPGAARRRKPGEKTAAEKDDGVAQIPLVRGNDDEKSQLVALAFAHSFAMNDGHFTSPQYARLVEAYGEAGAAKVLRTVRCVSFCSNLSLCIFASRRLLTPFFPSMVTVGNLLGNTLESFSARLGVTRFGSAVAHHSNIVSEGAVLALLVALPFAVALLPLYAVWRFVFAAVI
jgi:AhpD family alkylhydroperoxidase